MLVDAGKVVTRVNHLLPDVAGRHVPPNILLIYERALAGDNKSVSCPIKPKRNRKLLFTSSWSPSMKQSLTNVLIADTSSFLDTGMNFSEYMALLSGNTDLLDKAKLEKRIASLEGERKSFNKGRRDSEFKLESKTAELRNNTAVIDAMTEDWNRFLSVAQTDREGNRLNIIKVDGMDSADEKVIGKRLQEIAKNATTGGLYTPIGEFYGFPIKVVSERILKEGLEFTDNRFVVEENYKYTYNNGHLAMADPVAAARNFLNALERIPSIIDQYKTKNEVLEREIPQLQEIAGKVWKKEEELKQLKSELAALDRKIQLELAPPTPEVAEKEKEGQQVKLEAEDVRNRQAQYPENAPPQIRSPADSIVANHVIIGRPGLYAKEETRSKGLKI